MGTSKRRIIAIFASTLLLAYLQLNQVNFLTSLYANTTATRESSINHSNHQGTNNCLLNQGTRGKWKHDWGYANRTDYKMAGSYTNWHIASQKFQATYVQPFRLATSWKWQDDKCPVHEVSLSGFCQAAARLELTRFLILGDSLSIQFTISLLSLLGFPPEAHRTSFNGIMRPFHIPCADVFNDRTNQIVSFQVTIWMYRRSPLDDLMYLQKEADSNGTLANQQRVFVRDNPNRTAIIANTGAWINGMENYTQAFHSILNWIDSFPEAKSKIVAFYRPTIPGHVGCLPNQQGTNNSMTVVNGVANFNWATPLQEFPYNDYNEYTQHRDEVLESEMGTFVNMFNWLDFEDYNQYSQNMIRNRTENSTHIYWLNIFNSSVLRRDGHVGFGDCLHYYMPGPTDWWVHFFYSMMQELSS